MASKQLNSDDLWYVAQVMYTLVVLEIVDQEDDERVLRWCGYE